MLRNALTALALVVGAAAAQAGKDHDTARLTDGSTETGTLKSADIGGLVMVLNNGKTANHPWSQVAALQLAGAPQLQKALGQLGQGDAAAALATLTPLAGETKQRPAVRQEVLFNLAYAQQRTGQLADAAASYQTLTQEFPKTRYFAAIADGLYTCLGADADGARAALDKLASAAQTAGADPGTVAAIEARRARLWEAKRDFAKARSAYESARSKGVGPAVEAELQLGIARCYAGEERPADADKILRTLVADANAPRTVLAGAWNGIADGLRDEGRKQKSADRLLEALFGYLRGVVQYPPAPGEPTAEHERALAGASSCFRALAELEQDAEHRKLLEQRAQDRKAQLEREYPKSTYLTGS